jgi:hypothetical protein
MDQSDKVKENRLRRMADRQGLLLRRTRRRDPRAIDYGRYLLVDAQTNLIIAGTGALGRHQFTLDDVESFLTRD